MKNPQNSLNPPQKISFSQAQEILSNEKIEPPKTKQIPLFKALGRYLANDIFAPFNEPPAPRSNMDGYAICSHFLAKDSIDSILFEILPQDNPVQNLQIPHLPNNKPCAIKTFTGAFVPIGADIIVPIELVELLGENLELIQNTQKNIESSKKDSIKNAKKARYLRLCADFKAGDNIRAKGENYHKNELLISRGTRLKAQHIGLLASLNYGFIEVFKKPKIGILINGSELKEVDFSKERKIALKIDSISQNKGFAANDKLDSIKTDSIKLDSIKGENFKNKKSKIAAKADTKAHSKEQNFTILPQELSTIYNSNSHTIAALAQDLGAKTKIYPILKDDKSTIEAAFDKALKKCDLIISCGGSSVGDYDFVKDYVRKCKERAKFLGVNLKPGQHICYISPSPTNPYPHELNADSIESKINAKKISKKMPKKSQKKCAFFGLPGFPSAAFMSFYLLVRPYLAKACGGRISQIITKAELCESFEKKDAREEFRACNIWSENSKFYADFRGKKAFMGAILNNLCPIECPSIADFGGILIENTKSIESENKIEQNSLKTTPRLGFMRLLQGEYKKGDFCEVWIFE